MDEREGVEEARDFWRRRIHSLAGSGRRPNRCRSARGKAIWRESDITEKMASLENADEGETDTKTRRAGPAMNLLTLLGSCLQSLSVLVQLGVFRLGLLENRDVGVGVFPKSEEILVGCLCLGLISRQGVRSAQLQSR
jgi:hypothetical protein